MKKLLYLLTGLLFIIGCEEEKDCCVFPFDANFAFQSEAQGCSNFYVYKESQEQNLHLYVQGDRSALGLNLSEQSFPVTNEHLRVEILQFDGPIGNYACDDVANDQGEIITRWKAISGNVTIQITEDSISVNDWEMTYRVTIKLNEVQLENEQQEKATLESTTFENVFVGWLPG